MRGSKLLDPSRRKSGQRSSLLARRSSRSKLDYSLIPGYDADDPDAQQHGASLRPLEALKEERSELDKREEDVLTKIEAVNSLWESRRAPLDEELDGVRAKIAEVGEAIAQAERALLEPGMPEPLGPPSLAWVEGAIFSSVSSFVVATNLACMLFSARLERLGVAEHVDNVFLLWYIFELGARTAYHQRNLFFGRAGIVSWNWLDLVIVLGGILDQWLVSMLVPLGSSGSSSPLGAVKFLRFLRVLRVLKFVRAVLEGDARWTESDRFQVFMSGVICANALTMSLELDIAWSGWVFVENVFMAIYSFELVMKFKLQGCGYFTNMSSFIWNYLDVLLVFSGALDLWLLPAIHMVQGMLGYAADGGGKTVFMARVMELLRLMRIMRIARLVRLLKTIKPLYRLLLGVIESLKAMQWVMVLTLLMLYAGAIFWTSLVGKGLLYGGVPPPGGEKHFGTVATSLFSLFRIMNGDTSVVRIVDNTVFGQLLFAGFMVLSNWAILAILTSVVSDNMISASQQAAEDDRQKDKADEYLTRIGRLDVLFREIDRDGDGAIDKDEWREACEDPRLINELSLAASQSEKDLQSMFTHLAASKVKIDDTTGDAFNSDMNMVYFEDMVEHLNNTADPADKRCMLDVVARLHFMERKLEREIRCLWGAVGVGAERPVESLDGWSRSRSSPLLSAPARKAVDEGADDASCACGREAPKARKGRPPASPRSSPRIRKPGDLRRQSGSRRPSGASNGVVGAEEGITKL